MKKHKDFVLYIFNTSFRTLFYFTLIAIAFSLTFKSPTKIKDSLVQTNAYSRFVSLLIDESINGKKDTGSLPLSDPKVQQIILRSFPAEDLQNKTEAVVENIYRWLSGATNQPNLVIDFSANNENLAKGLSAYAFDRLKQQPICDSIPLEVSPFTAECQPADIDFVQEQLNLENQLKSKPILIPKNSYSAQDLPKDDNGKTIFDKYSYAPSVYRYLAWSPYVLGLLTILAASVIVMLASKKRLGIAVIGSGLISSSVYIVLTPIVFIYVLPYFISGFKSQSNSKNISGLIGEVESKLGLGFNFQLIYIGLVFALIGLILALVARLMTPKSKYSKISKKSGLVSAISPKILKNGIAKLTARDVPIQSSEGPKKRSESYSRNKKYRKIPKKEI